MTQKITEFRDKYDFLSNFYAVQITHEDITYPTVEHAFQAQKTLNHNVRYAICRQLTPGKAKRAGRSVEIRPDWEDIKLDVMTELVRKKFGNELLRHKLLETGDAELIEGNSWHDTFWGVCNSIGQNHLGRILMQVRDELM